MPARIHLPSTVGLVGAREVRTSAGRPARLIDVVPGARRVGRGCGAQRGYTEKYRGAAVHISLRPRLNVEVVMKAEIVNAVVDKVAVGARTGDGEVGTSRSS